MKKMLVPTVRFPEFRDAGDWEEKKLGDLSQIVRGGSPRPIDEYITSDVNGLNWLKIADVDKESKYVTFTKERVLHTALSKSREVNPGDLIMSNSMSFGRPYILKIKSCIHDGWIAVTKIDGQASRDYLYYLILSPASQEYFVNNAAGSGVQNLNVDIIKLLPVPTPKYAEQQKIADCLSSIDVLISAQSRKVDALKIHKKGLMQKLFPQEGKVVPSLRFPEFRDAAGWGRRNFYDLLDDIIDFRGRTPLKLGMNWGGGNIVSLSANNVKNGYVDFDAECNLGSEALYEKWMGGVSLKEGDIVFTMEAPLGNALLVPDSQRYILSQRVVAFKTKKDVVNKFLIQFIWSERFQDELKQLSTGSTAKGINQKTLKKVDVILPVEEKEQQMIADFLSGLDELIRAHSRKLDDLKTHKKGLMQALFPTVDEVGE